MPRLLGVQARACAPMWSLFSFGPAGLGWVTEGETLAEGIRVKYPVRGDQLLQTVEASQGGFFAVDEEDILPARDQLAQRGFYVEPTSAVVWPVLNALSAEFPDPIVAVLTGSGYKYRG
jgi:threonine synthase